MMIERLGKKHIIVIVSVVAILCVAAVAYVSYTELNKEYNVDVNVVGDGTITGEGTYDEGSSVTLKAVPDYGYTFSGWYDNGKFISNVATLKTTADDSHNLKAVFEKITYTIAVSSNYTGGTVTAGGSYKYQTKVNLSATVNAGYTFAGWHEGNKIISTSTTFSYEVTKNSTITAEYAIVHDATFTLSNSSPLEDQTFTCTSKYNVEIQSRSWTVTLSDNNLGTLSYSDTWSKTSANCEITSNEPAVLDITQNITYKDGKTATHTESVLVDGTVSKDYTWDYSYNVNVNNNWWIFNWTSVDKMNKTVTISLDLQFSDYVDYVDDTVTRFAAQSSLRTYYINSMVTYDDPVIVGLANFFTEYTKGLTSLERAQCVLNFVQSIKYQYDTDFNGQAEYFKFPYETLYNLRGDCEDTAILFAAIIKAMGYDVVLLQLPGHMAAGIDVSGVSGTSYSLNGIKYYYCETATEGGYRSIGSVPSSFSGVSAILYHIT